MIVYIMVYMMVYMIILRKTDATKIFFFFPLFM